MSQEYKLIKIDKKNFLKVFFLYLRRALTLSAELLSALLTGLPYSLGNGQIGRIGQK